MKVSDFASIDPEKVSAASPHAVQNFLRGHWVQSKKSIMLPDPLNGEKFMTIPDTQSNETEDFISSLNTCSKTGLHNPFKNPERYVRYGTVCANAATAFRQPEVNDFLVRLIQRVVPKHEAQARAEVFVTMKFLENFGGDQVRFLARSFQVPGDHTGQMSSGYRWPFGPVVIIAPFNFPLEIPMLQLMGALFMGNKVLLKCDSRVSVVMEQALRLLHACGLPKGDLDFINCGGPVMHDILMKAQPRMTQFTGSSRVAEMLAKDLHGRIKVEDAGWDWKVLGPDVHDIDFVAYTSDQDAYAYSGQKCSAQSALFMHKNWTKAGLLDKIKALAERRSLSDLTLTPVLTVNNERFLSHVKAFLAIPGAELLFGGQLLQNHKIPAVYGSFQPTAIKIPLKQLLSAQFGKLCMTEIFGPFQIVVEYDDAEIPDVIQALENCEAHLTAAIVSRDIQFQQHMIAHTVNGTTYSGIRARTTGAPQNHWFGPAGDPRGGGIGTPEAIKFVWSCHREIIYDQGPVPGGWKLPKAT
jgi:1-pyrroline-5-carboxylate dehydrogenase